MHGNIPISTIRLDGGTQPRVELSESVVADYAEKMAAGEMKTRLQQKAVREARRCARMNAPKGIHYTDGMAWADRPRRSCAGEQAPPFRGPPPEVPADEPHTWSESWWFIAPALVIAAVLLVSASQGWLP